MLHFGGYNPTSRKAEETRMQKFRIKFKIFGILFTQRHRRDPNNRILHFLPYFKWLAGDFCTILIITYILLKSLFQFSPNSGENSFVFPRITVVLDRCHFRVWQQKRCAAKYRNSSPEIFEFKAGEICIHAQHVLGKQTQRKSTFFRSNPSQCPLS